MDDDDDDDVMDDVMFVMYCTEYGVCVWYI